MIANLSIHKRRRSQTEASDRLHQLDHARPLIDPRMALDELGGEPRDRGSGEPAATSEFTNTERFVGGSDELKEEERALDRGRR